MEGAVRTKNALMATTAVTALTAILGPLTGDDKKALNTLREATEACDWPKVSSSAVAVLEAMRVISRGDAPVGSERQPHLHGDMKRLIKEFGGTPASK